MMNMKSKNQIEIWVVYENPSDFPGQTVARKWLEPGGATRTIMRGSLKSLRDNFHLSGLVRVERHPSDDLVVVEAWL